MHVSRTNLGVGTAAVGVAALLISTLLPAAQASNGSGGSSGAPPGYVRIPKLAYTPTAGSRTSAAPTPALRFRFTLSMKVRNRVRRMPLARAVSDPTSELRRIPEPSAVPSALAPTPVPPPR